MHRHTIIRVQIWHFLRYLCNFFLLLSWVFSSVSICDCLFLIFSCRLLPNERAWQVSQKTWIFFLLVLFSICTREIRKFTLKRWFEFALVSTFTARASLFLFECKRGFVVSVCLCVSVWFCLLFLIICFPFIFLQQFSVILWTSFCYVFFLTRQTSTLTFFVCECFCCVIGFVYCVWWCFFCCV